jgi:hypothetical protein
MTNDEQIRILDGLWDDYLSLWPHAETIVRKIKRTSSAEVRSKLIAELRNLDSKRLKLLDQIDEIAHPASGVLTEGSPAAQRPTKPSVSPSEVGHWDHPDRE